MTVVPTEARGVEAVTVAEAVAELGRGVQQGRASTAVWSTGLSPLDAHVGGGMHAGDLVLLAGPQGAGKTTIALQVARNVVAHGGEAVYVCFEHSVAQLVERLVVMEAALVAGSIGPTLEEVRSRLEHGAPSLERALDGLPGVPEALRRIESYGTRLRLVGARGDVTDLDDIAAYARGGDGPCLVVVDYLQKVVVAGVDDEDLRVARIATRLKDLALELGCPVLAVTAVDRAGLDARRIRSRHLKGSVTLAYEADLVVVVQDKFDIVAREHLVYDLTLAEEFRRWFVWSVEKNRHGADHVEMEFRKRLSQGYVEPHGRPVTDALVDERVHIG